MTDPSDSTADQPTINLAMYPGDEHQPGRGLLVRVLWQLVSLLFFESGWCPISTIRVWWLRRFGASIGKGVVIKPNVRIKYPWRLEIGNHCWIGQDAWLDNLDQITLENNICISQQVYLCTGSHDHRRQTFNLITKPIVLREGCWVGARATILAGVTVGRGAIVSAGTVMKRDVPARRLLAGNPAQDLGPVEVPS